MITLLDKIKLALRIDSNAFNEEIQDLIESAKLDLYAGGVSQESIDAPDAWVQMAITLYAKSNFGMANPDSEKYSDAYHNVRQKLSLSGKHNVLE